MMKRLLAIAFLVVACSGPPGSTGLPPTEDTNDVETPTPAATATPTVEPTEQAATTPAPTPAGPMDIVLVESGFTAFKGSTPYAMYGVVFENPNSSIWVATIEVTVTFFDKGGDVLSTDDNTIQQALPGERSAVGEVAFDTPGAAKMDVDFAVDWKDVDFVTGSFTFSKAKLTHDTYSAKATGIAKCDFDVDQEDVKVVAIFRDKNDRVIAGDFDYLDRVRCEKGSGIAIDTLDDIKRAVKATFYAG